MVLHVDYGQGPEGYFSGGENNRIRKHLLHC